MASAPACAAAAVLALTAALAPARADDAVRPPPQAIENVYQNSQELPPEHARENPRERARENQRGNARGNGREGAHETPHPAVHVCLNQKERRAAVEKGAVIHLAAALHSVKGRTRGALIRARLCRGHGGHPALVYVLTVLARDGKVTRYYVDAAKGSVVGER